MSGIIPVEYPTWPALGGVPVNPELVVPGALGVVVVGNAVRDGLGIWSFGIGALGAVTTLLALASLHTLYADTCGCLFFGRLFTLAAGVPLAALVLGRRVIGRKRVRNTRRGTFGYRPAALVAFLAPIFLSLFYTYVYP